MNYRLPDTKWGSFSFSWDNTYYASYEEDKDGNNQVGEYIDGSNQWRIRSNLYVDWTLGDFGINYGLRYKSGLTESCLLGPATRGYCSDPDNQKNHIGATTYHDVQFRYNTPWNGTVMLGLNNAWDKQPPVSYSTSYNMFDPQYDLPGRYMYMQYKQKF